MASFSGVELLHLGGWGSHAVRSGWGHAFVILHAFSPVLKYLRVDISSLPLSHFFDLVLSFPLLEDLEIVDSYSEPIGNWGDSDGMPTVSQPSSPPVFPARSLRVYLSEGIGSTVHRLLSLQNVFRFQKLTLGWHCEEDISLTMALIERCSRTLEYLEVGYHLCGTSINDPRPYG